jgi:hypothetical protein
VLGRNSRVGSPARNLLGIVIVTSSHRSLLVKEEAGQRRPREGGSAGPNLESEQEEYTRMEEVPALAGMVGKGKNEKAST